MGGPLSAESWQVVCSSGWTYAERPTALLRSGERLEIEGVERMWRSPQGRNFIVRLVDKRKFHLLYHETEDHWLVEAG
jgi:hypothetical protein